MKTKIVKNYCYEGLGFPVLLDEVEIVEYNGEYCPKIDVKKVADIVIREIAQQDTRLTGDQIRFIRSYFEMPLREFGEQVVHETHAAVSKWEKKGSQPTNMNKNTEFALRLYILEKTCTQNKAHRNQFYDRYMEIKECINAKNDESHALNISMQAL
jgi:DNA-binding transcriptional regulator YiaG